MNDEPLKFTKEQQREVMQAKLEDEQRRRILFSIDDEFKELLKNLRNAKPQERSEEARRFAVAITGLEKLYAYYIVFIGAI